MLGICIQLPTTLETVAGGPLATVGVVPFDLTTLALVVTVVLIAGAVTGIAGFGFALLGTMALATVFPPSVAVVVMIVPILATNLSLLDELDRSSLQSCGRRFFPYIVATLGGTVVGMWLLESIPAQPLTLALGVLTLAYVIQGAVSIPGLNTIQTRCFVEQPGVMVGLGGLSGLVFGATNVGVQIVAYIESRNLGPGLFVGVIALVFVGVNTLRVGAAAVFGLYPSLGVAFLSIGLAIPTIVGVVAGRRLRPLLSDRHQHIGVLGLLTLVGVRLVLGGLGVA